ncbi:MAG: serine hydrolase domain-containing protein [Paenisporosarcina sp.]
MELKNIHIKERMQHYNVAGLSLTLINNGQISESSSFGVLEAGTSKEVDNHSIFNACSISKFLTSILVFKLSDQGLLDINENVNHRLTSWKVPENEFTQKNKVTIQNLLSHQSGIVDPEGSFSEMTTTQSSPNMTDLLMGKTSYCNDPIEVKYLPGTDFHYSDAGFCIIQQLIEDICEKPFEEIMKELLFAPLKMTNSTFEKTIPTTRKEQLSCGHNKDGKVVEGTYPIYPFPAASGLWTTPTDIAKLVLELMNSLKGESKISLSKNSVRELFDFKGCKDWNGLGMFLDGSEQETEISSLGWGVGFQCMMVAYPYLGKGAIIMTNTDLGFHQLKGIIGEIYYSLK